MDKTIDAQVQTLADWTKRQDTQGAAKEPATATAGAAATPAELASGAE